MSVRKKLSSPRPCFRRNYHHHPRANETNVDAATVTNATSISPSPPLAPIQHTAAATMTTTDCNRHLAITDPSSPGSFIPLCCRNHHHNPHQWQNFATFVFVPTIISRIRNRHSQLLNSYKFFLFVSSQSWRIQLTILILLWRKEGTLVRSFITSEVVELEFSNSRSLRF